MSQRRRSRSASRPKPPGTRRAASEPSRPAADAGPAGADPAGPVDATPDAPLFNVALFTKPAFWVVAGLLAATFWVYAPVRQHDFVTIDDPGYLTLNPHVTAGLSAAGVAWAFTTGHMANWHPITWVSHMLDAELFGMRPGAHHLVSVVIHAANTILLFALLRRMTGATGRSAVVAALFAVHPLHVESVAWLSERKDVLSTFFWLLTMWLYVGYVRQPGWMRYAGVLIVFAIGLMAKPMLVTLPLVLLLMDYWPLGRVPDLKVRPPDGAQPDLKVRPTYGTRRPAWMLIREKLPMLALVLASSVITLIVQREGGAVASLGRLPLLTRFSNAFVSYFTYLGKTFWPVDLAVFYPYDRTLTIGLGLAALAGLIGLTVVVLRAARARPYLAVGWLWYLGTLVPVIGFVQVGTQAVADRYTYVPLIGIFLLIAWGVPDLLSRLPGRRVVLAAATVALIAGCSMMARAQVRTWRDGQTLWEHALDATTGNYLAHSLLGGLLGERGRHQEALVHLREAVRLDPAYPDARLNLGISLVSLGKVEEGIAEYRAAIRLKPTMASAHLSLGLALASQQKHDEALTAFQTALALDPNLADAHRGLAMALSRQGRNADAERHYAEAVRLNPDAADAQRKLGKARFEEGKAPEAIAAYREAIRLKPGFAEAHSDLGFALMATGQPDAAAIHFGEAIRLQPDLVDPRLHFGFMLAATGRFAEALVHFTEAVRLSPESEVAHSYRGMALANLGRVDEARAEFETVLRLNPSNDGARRGLAALTGRGRGGAPDAGGRW